MMMRNMQTMTMDTTEGMDREMFSELAKEHHRELLVYARALTREDTLSRDIVQDSFVVAWRNKEKFDQDRDFATWMRGIVKNKWRESLRKNQRLVTLEDDILESMDAEMRDWQSMRNDGGPTVFMRLEDCLTKLPASMLEAVKSFYYDGNSSDEVAQILEVGSSTVRKRLERARSGLKECLGK